MPDIQTILAENPNLVWIGGGAAGAFLLLLIVLLMSLGRKKKPGPSPAKSAAAAPAAEAASAMRAPPRADPPVVAAAPPKPQEKPASDSEGIRADLSLGTVEWMKTNGKAAGGVVDSAGYHVPPGEGFVSKASLPVTPGATYQMSFTAATTKDSTNGEAGNFAVGPVFFDAAGKVAKWWREQPELKMANGVRAGSVQSPAPAAAVRVHMGIRGSVGKDKLAGDCIVAFSGLSLKQT